MANTERVQDLIQQIENHKGDWTPKTWNDLPRHSPENEWKAGRIGTNPSNLHGHIAFAINRDIFFESLSNTPSKLNQNIPRKRNSNDHEQLFCRQTAHYLDIEIHDARDLLSPHQIKKWRVVTKRRTIRTLKHLAATNQIKWEGNSWETIEVARPDHTITSTHRR